MDLGNWASLSGGPFHYHVVFLYGLFQLRHFWIMISESAWFEASCRCCRGGIEVAVRVVEVTLPNGAVALVQATDLDDGGGQVAEKVGWKDTFDFAGVSETLEGIAQAVRSGLEKATPSKTTVELGIELAVKSGKLTGLVVEGGAAASLKVTLEWGTEAAANVSGKLQRPEPTDHPAPPVRGVHHR